MLVELAVRDLGVIAELSLDFGPGLCALTGETGAGKTMVVEALALLLGGKADPSRVRPGAESSIVEGRFVVDDVETVLRRVVPREGRSRGYVNAEMATVAHLAEVGGTLVEICGQHAHQQLQTTRAQREALDRFAKIDLDPLHEAQSRRRELVAQLGALGGDERARAREIDLLRFQLAELDAAAIERADEDELLSAREDLLSDAVAHQEAAGHAVALLSLDDGAGEQLAAASAAIERRAPFDRVAERLASVLAEVGDVLSELRSIAEGIEMDPEQLETVRQRRQTLVELRRKYGESLEDVMAFHRELADRLAELESHEARAAALESALAAARAHEAEAAAVVGAARRKAAPRLAKAVAARLAELAMPRAVVEVRVSDDDPGDEVEFLMSANSGMAPQPISKAASGGEMSRTMLALHQILSVGAPTMVFDEVDAGIGGQAAGAVGHALSAIAAGRQAIVVTHLAQVAAYADTQLSVSKSSGRLAVTTIERLAEPERVIELSRMLSGSPDSETARRHAAELLEAAAFDRVQ